MDNETVAWLEQYLKQRKGALMMVTHDRYFFDRVINRTLEIDNGTGYLYTGNYSLFLEKRAERRIEEASAAKKLNNIYRKELAWIKRGAEARRTKQKFRVDRFAEIEDEAKNIKKEENLEISSAGTRLGRTVIECDGVGLDYAGTTYIDDFSYTLLRNDRVGIVGPNGSGKTTLIEIIAGRITPDSIASFLTVILESWSISEMSASTWKARMAQKFQLRRCWNVFCFHRNCNGYQ